MESERGECSEPFQAVPAAPSRRDCRPSASPLREGFIPTIESEDKQL